MRRFEVVSVTTIDAEPPANEGHPEHHRLGYAVLDTEALQLKATLLYLPEQLDAALRSRQELEEADRLRAHWPDARDPEVVALTSDPGFTADEPEWINYGPVRRQHKACNLIARRRAGL